MLSKRKYKRNQVYRSIYTGSLHKIVDIKGDILTLISKNSGKVFSCHKLWLTGSEQVPYRIWINKKSVVGKLADWFHDLLELRS